MKDKQYLGDGGSVTTKHPAECLTAWVEHDGHRYSLCLVKHHWTNEGTATIERLTDEDNRRGEPVSAVFLDHGIWRITGTGEGPNALSVEFNALDDMADDPAIVVNLLLADLDLDCFGAEAWEQYS